MSSALRAWSAHDAAVPSGALESWAAKRNLRGWVIGPHSFVVAGVDVDARDAFTVEHVSVPGVVLEGEHGLEPERPELSDRGALEPRHLGVVAAVAHHEHVPPQAVMGQPGQCLR